MGLWGEWVRACGAGGFRPGSALLWGVGSVAFADAVQEVGGGSLDPGVDVARTVQGRGPGERSGCEDQGAGRGTVERRLLVAEGARAVAVRGVREEYPALVLGESGRAGSAPELAGTRVSASSAPRAAVSTVRP